MVDHRGEVPPDDRGRNVDHLVGVRVDLDETLEVRIVRGMADDDLTLVQLGLLLFGIVAQLTAEHARIEKDVKVIVVIPEEKETGPSLDGVPPVILHDDREQGRAEPIQDFLQDILRKILDHLLRESELFERPVRDFIHLV